MSLIVRKSGFACHSSASNRLSPARCLGSAGIPDMPGQRAPKLFQVSMAEVHICMFRSTAAWKVRAGSAADRSHTVRSARRTSAQSTGTMSWNGLAFHIAPTELRIGF